MNSKTMYKVIKVLRFSPEGATLKEISWRTRENPREVYHILLELNSKKMIKILTSGSVKKWILLNKNF